MCPSKELRAAYVEENFIYIYCHRQTQRDNFINAARENTTKRISFSVSPNISQCIYGSFVTFAETPERVLDNEPSAAHVDKKWWGCYYLSQLPEFFLLL